MPRLHLIDHPLVGCHMTRARSVRSDAAAFREAVRSLATLVAVEAMRDLPLEGIEIETPLERCPGVRLASRLGLVPILRAGLGMVDPLLALIPEAEVWHLGLYRDERTARPISYYNRLKPDAPVAAALVLDPMLATGGSAAWACQTLKAWGVPSIKALSIIAAPEGIARVHGEFPEVEIYTCAVDRGLNEHFFIVPGLGDAGDRIFNTPT